MSVRYHPGRRKRRQTMDDLAHGVVFRQLIGEKRLSYDQRIALEALVEADAAFNGNANRERADKAVEIALDVSRNTARDQITALEALGLVEFARTTHGSCVRIPDPTRAAFRGLEILERKIRMVVLAEDEGIDLDVTQDRDHLKACKIYVSSSDEELDAGMEATVLGELKKEEVLLKDRKARELASRSGGAVLRLSLAAIFSVGAMIASAGDALADKAGTVGLDALLVQASLLDKAGTVGLLFV